VIAIGEDDFIDVLQGVEIRPIAFLWRRWINKHRAPIERDGVAVQVPGPVGVSRAPGKDAGIVERCLVE